MGLGLRHRPVVLVALVIVAALVAVVWLGQRRLTYFPDRTSPSPPADAQEVTLETADGLRLVAWQFAPTGEDRNTAALVAPGNGGNRGGRVVLARELAGAGLTVLLLEYRGYGGNPGRPSEGGLALDARAAAAHLSGAGFRRIVYFGESLGSAVVAELAVEVPPAGLILRSPFVDLATVGTYHYPYLPVRALARDKFPVADHIGRVGVPTVVIYGDADSTVPPEQSRTVAERAAGPVSVVVVPGADHNDAALFHGPLVIDAVADLVDHLRP